MLRATPFKRAEIKVSGTFQGKKFAPQWLVARDRLAPAGAPLPSLRVARGGRRAWSLARHTTAERMDALLGYDSDDSPVSRAASRDAPPDPKRPRLVDDPPDDATSSGRVRAFPHVDGNFATHVYIPVDIPRRPRAALARRLAALVALAPSLRPVGRDAPPDPTLDPDALVPDHLHVSLSRVFPIRIDARASLLAALRRALASLDAFHADVGPSFRVFLNDARDTAFVALDVSPGLERRPRRRRRPLRRPSRPFPSDGTRGGRGAGRSRLSHVLPPTGAARLPVVVSGRGRGGGGESRRRSRRVRGPESRRARRGGREVDRARGSRRV